MKSSIPVRTEGFIKEVVAWAFVIFWTQWPWPYRVHLKYTQDGQVLIDQTYTVSGMRMRRLIWGDILSIDEIHMAMFDLAEDEYVRLRIAGVR